MAGRHDLNKIGIGQEWKNYKFPTLIQHEIVKLSKKPIIYKNTAFIKIMFNQFVNDQINS